MRFDKDRIDLVSKHVLTNCNYNQNKNKNNPGTHKAREGKTMITNGLSLIDFYKKYNL